MLLASSTPPPPQIWLLKTNSTSFGDLLNIYTSYIYIYIYLGACLQPHAYIDDLVSISRGVGFIPIESKCNFWDYFLLHSHSINGIFLHLTRDACLSTVSNNMLNNMTSTYAVGRLGMVAFAWRETLQECKVSPNVVDCECFINLYRIHIRACKSDYAEASLIHTNPRVGVASSPCNWSVS